MEEFEGPKKFYIKKENRHDWGILTYREMVIDPTKVPPSDFDYGLREREGEDGDEYIEVIDDLPSDVEMANNPDIRAIMEAFEHLDFERDRS